MEKKGKKIWKSEQKKDLKKKGKKIWKSEQKKDLEKWREKRFGKEKGNLRNKKTQGQFESNAYPALFHPVTRNVDGGRVGMRPFPKLKAYPTCLLTKKAGHPGVEPRRCFHSGPFAIFCLEENDTFLKKF